MFLFVVPINSHNGFSVFVLLLLVVVVLCVHTTFKKFGVCMIFFLFIFFKDITAVIYQRCINQFKSSIKDIYNVMKSKNPENEYHRFHRNIKQYNYYYFIFN